MIALIAVAYVNCH